MNTIPKYNSIYREILDESKTIQGLEGIEEQEILDFVIGEVMERLTAADAENEIDEIKGAAVIGSRGRGTAREDSDLDVVIEYSGSMREDDFFNTVNDDDYEYGRISFGGYDVDVNPIRKQESGSLEEFLKRSNQYDLEQLSKVSK